MNVSEYVDGVRGGNRAWIARAITLVESTRADHRRLAQEVLVELTPLGGASRRVGITGVPGVGKSTFIDALGSRLIAAGHRVAVLAVDPSSTRTRGSILGDKTRMARLAVDEDAFVRPSPTSGTLGGVATATREAIVVVEAAGYDTVLVETVGVGQSETAVAEMVDSFLLLTLARTGDQLQGIKKGVLELADVIAVNKADGSHLVDAKRAARELAGALRLMGTPAPVVTCSAIEETGLDEVWAHVVRHQDTLADSGELEARRRQQQVGWMWATVRGAVLDRLRTHPAVTAIAPACEKEVLDGTLTPSLAAARLLEAFSASSEVVVERDAPRDADLVRGDPPLEEV